MLIPLTMGFANFLTNTEAVSATLAQMSQMVTPLISFIGAAVGAFSSLGNLLGGFISGVMPGLMGGVSAVATALLNFYAYAMTIVDRISSTLSPGLAMLGRGIGSVVHGIGSILAPVIRLVGGLFLGIYDIGTRLLMPVINALIGGFGMIMDAIGQFMVFIGDLLGRAATAMTPWMAGGAPESESTRSMRAMLDGFTASLEGAGGAAIGDSVADGAAHAAARPTPGGRGGGVTQDFRNSRFSIQQKFEEGFDPDRIAAAFATDLGRLGERRLQSGLEPIFGVR